MPDIFYFYYSYPVFPNPNIAIRILIIMQIGTNSYIMLIFGIFLCGHIFTCINVKKKRAYLSLSSIQHIFKNLILNWKLGYSFQ
jgi:hypothetical protein